MTTCSRSLFALIALGCGSAVPSGSIQLEAGDPAPDWARGPSACPARHRCVVGHAGGAPSAAAATRAAVLDGRQQLAEGALPVEVQGRYVAERTDDARTVRGRIEARLAGRLPALGRLAVATRRQVVPGLKGARVHHEAWVLLSADSAHLDALYAEESRRATTEARQIEAALDAAAPATWAAGAATLVGLRSRVDSLIHGQARAAAEARWREAAEAHVARLSVALVSASLERAHRRLSLRLSASGRPLAGVAVEATGACGPGAGRTDPEGVARIDLPPSLDDCTISLEVAGLAGPSLRSRACVHLRWSVAPAAGLGASAQRRLSREGDALIAARRCVGDPHEVALQLEGRVRATANAPRQSRRGVYQLGCAGVVAVADAAGATLARRAIQEALLANAPHTLHSECAARLEQAGLSTLRAALARFTPPKGRPK